jgi:hypothetical protein
MSKAYIVKNVRLCFPYLFRKAVFEGEETKFEALFILDKPKGEHKKPQAQIQKAVDALVADVLGGTPPKARYMAWKDDKLRDIMENNRPEYEGFQTLKAGNKSRPVVVDQRGQPVTEEDALFFAGCRVDVKIEPWASSKSKYRPVGFNLLAVVFRPADEDQEDAQPFGSGNVSFDEAMEGFNITEEDDDIMGDFGDDDEDDIPH